MRIHVNVVTEGFAEQARAYAEFRMFSALARFERQIEAATLVLTESAEPQPVVTCAVAITFAGGARLRIRTRGEHPYEAINRAADRVSDLVRQEHSAVLLS
jgi:hypothetical protein